MSLDHFNMSLFRFTYVAEETVMMPRYKGGVLRGGFGFALKRVTCALRQSRCETCMLKENCAYSQIFETPIPQDSKYLRSQPFAPHPFVLEPPLEEKTEYSPGDEMAFQLLLIGESIDLIPYFVLGFHTLGQWGLGRKIQGRRGRCFLQKVESVDAQANRHVIYTGDTMGLSGEYRTLTMADIEDATELNGEPDTVSLEFITPTRFRSSGSLQDSIDFEMLMRALLRRILALSYFHCHHDPELDYADLVLRSRQTIQKVTEELEWMDWSRTSNRQNARLVMGGFRGKVTFSGDLREYIPFLRLGEYIHVGKGTAFGLGKYIIS